LKPVKAVETDKRFVDEILPSVEEAEGGDRARRFIEQFWEHDQVVFDASGSR